MKYCVFTSLDSIFSREIDMHLNFCVQQPKTQLRSIVRFCRHQDVQLYLYAVAANGLHVVPIGLWYSLPYVNALSLQTDKKHLLMCKAEQCASCQMPTYCACTLTMQALSLACVHAGYQSS